jgi:hypothetical protein
MAVGATEWLALMDGEYLSDFVVGGGAAVKFVVADAAGRTRLASAFAEMAAGRGTVLARLGCDEVRLHMMQDVFFAVSRQLDWETDAQGFVERMFEGQGYRWPTPGEPVALKEIAEANHVDVTILRREFNGWLTRDVMNDAGMAQDFRLALIRLCEDRLFPAGDQEASATPIRQWLRGELRGLGPLKSASIYTRITRHNARAMLRSLCRWLRLAGHSGLFLTIDIAQITQTAPEGLRYAPGAVMDAYEVLRQLVDDADLFAGLFLVVLADPAFVGDDEKRAVGAYAALKMRIWDDVKATARDNPLAPMVLIDAGR